MGWNPFIDGYGGRFYRCSGRIVDHTFLAVVISRFTSLGCRRRHFIGGLVCDLDRFADAHAVRRTHPPTRVVAQMGGHYSLFSTG